MSFVNESEHEFSDISSERYRVYVFENCEVRIEHPQKISVSKSGGHRLWDGTRSHYIPPRWVHLYWQPFDGEPHFVK